MKTMNLDDFRPLMEKVVSYISEGRYDKVRDFLLKEGRLTIDALEQEVETYRRNAKVLPLSKESFSGISQITMFSRHVPSVYLPLLTEDKESDEMRLGLYCGYIGGQPAIKVFDLVYL